MFARYWNSCIDVVEDIIRKHMNDGWIPVEFFGLPENNEHNSVFWITIECDSGHRRTVKARWDYYRGCFEYQNGKKVLQDVVAYKQYCEPKPYSPEPLETRKELEEDSKGERENE